MFFVILTLLLIIVEVALATFVASRAWSYRPSRLFVLFSGAIVLVLCATILRDLSPTPQAAYPWLGLLQIGVGLYLLLLMLLLSSLFAPEWWRGRMPAVAWISVPYLLGIAVLALDIFGPLELVINGARFEEVYRFTYHSPGDVWMRFYSLGGQAVFLTLLGVALARRRYREQRPAIVAIIAALVLSVALAGASGVLTGFVRFVVLAQTLPIVSALAYAILGTQLFLPTRAALDQALQSLRDAVAVLDRDGKVAFVNPAGERLGLTTGARPADRLAAIVEELDRAGGPLPAVAADLGLAGPQTPGARRLRFGERTVEVSATAVRDSQDRRRGTLLLGRDVSELLRRTDELEQERERLAAALGQVEAEQRQRDQLAATVRSLALPLIPVLPGVIVIPLIGDFTAERLDDFLNVLLQGIERRRADTVLIDVTGIALLDTAGAQGLLGGVRAAGLLGARCVLVGVRPEVAESLVALGVDLDELRSVQTLEQAVVERVSRR